MTLQKTIRRLFPDVVVSPALVVVATDSRHYAGLSKNVFRFSPTRANSEDLDRIHGTNERISVDNYRDTVLFYHHLLSAATS